MRKPGKTAFLLALPVLALGCRAQARRGPSIADSVADKFVADAASAPPAPNARMAAAFKQLTDCSAKRIRASDIAQNDPPASIDAKVHTAMQACEIEVYGKRVS